MPPSPPMPTEPQPAVHCPDATTDELLRAVAEQHGDRDAYVEAGGERLTFAQWDRAADGPAAGLAELGVGEGDVVARLLPSCVDYAICYLAAMRLGAITSGINPRLGPGEVASILRRSDSRVLVIDDDRESAPSSAALVRRRELAALSQRPPSGGLDA